MENLLPKIGITMGDAAGIGAEIVLKALVNGNLNRFCQPIIIGDLNFLMDSAQKLSLKVNFFEITNEIQQSPLKISVYNLNNLPPSVETGKDSAVTGKASAEYIESAINLWRAGQIDAVATAPISKKAIGLGGYNYPGHTEFLAELTETEEFAMSFFADKLRIILLSTHVSLRNAIELVKRDRLVDLIKFSHKSLSKLLKRNVKLAIAGLNPHASEDGMFGSEESQEIIPAVGICRDSFGIDVKGPFSPDTIFLRAQKGEFDGVIACYHDQATIAVKCLSFGESVNVTLGLPIIRTSVDHGTAYDIAGKNMADASSMTAAIKLAADLASGKVN